MGAETVLVLSAIAAEALKGAAVGAAVGGVTGGGKGALRGAALGGLTGGAVGGVGAAVNSATSAAAPIVNSATEQVVTQVPGAVAEGAVEAASGVQPALPQVGMQAPQSTGLLDTAISGGKALAGNRLVQGAVASGAGGYAAKLLAGGSSPAKIPQPALGDSGAAARAAAERERARKKGQGVGSTILSGPLGVSSPASVGAKVLLGA